LEIEEADVRELIGGSFLTVCTFPNDGGMWNDEAVLIGEWIGNDGATWTGEAGQIVDVPSIFVSIFNWIISRRRERLSDANLR
jgi:hypothetical protein